MTVLIWTRSPVARDMVSLVLSRAGLGVRVVFGPAELREAAGECPGTWVLVLGPSFSPEEAQAIGHAFADGAHPVRVVLLEDLLEPLPTTEVVHDAPTNVLRLPVRVRPLLDAVHGRLAA